MVNTFPLAVLQRGSSKAYVSQECSGQIRCPAYKSEKIVIKQLTCKAAARPNDPKFGQRRAHENVDGLHTRADLELDC